MSQFMLRILVLLLSSPDTLLAFADKVIATIKSVANESGKEWLSFAVQIFETILHNEDLLEEFCNWVQNLTSLTKHAQAVGDSNVLLSDASTVGLAQSIERVTGINWQKIIDLLIQILPIILPLILKTEEETHNETPNENID